MIRVNQDIVIRPPRMEDAAWIMRMENSKETVRVSAHDGHFSLADIQHFIMTSQGLEIEGQGRWMICSTQGRRLGMVDLFELDRFNDCVELGILIDRKFRREGIGKKALNLVIAYCKKELDLQTLKVEVQDGNTASLTFFEDFGFSASGLQDGIRTLELRLT